MKLAREGAHAIERSASQFEQQMVRTFSLHQARGAERYFAVTVDVPGNVEIPGFMHAALDNQQAVSPQVPAAPRNAFDASKIGPFDRAGGQFFATRRKKTHLAHVRSCSYRETTVTNNAGGVVAIVVCQTPASLSLRTVFRLATPFEHLRDITARIMLPARDDARNSLYQAVHVTHSVNGCFPSGVLYSAPSMDGQIPES